ncbi:hypothetical protein EON63_15560 [archaeon]|nr:MAG: hypothetical protein EON63_15560 [archaeon]
MYVCVWQTVCVCSMGCVCVCVDSTYTYIPCADIYILVCVLYAYTCLWFSLPYFISHTHILIP